MQCQTFFRSCPRELENSIRDYWDQKVPRLDHLLQRFPSGSIHLRLGITHRGRQFETRAVLLLPRATLVATAVDDSYQGSLDMVADKLAKEIRRHVDTRTRESVAYRRDASRRDWLRVDQHLRDHHQEDHREAFFELMRPTLRSLQQHARRELILAQLGGELRSGYTTISELVDETIILAWDRFAQRPDHIPLESWLVELLHEALQSTIEASDSIPLQAPLDPDDPRFDVENGWLAENEPFWEDVRPLAYHDVLPSHDVAEAFAEDDERDQEQALLSLLSDIDQEQRRTFTLHVVEGWGEDEIAMLQGRKQSDVHRDIEAVNEILSVRRQ